MVKEWYSITEVAGLLGRAEFTVREWCRLGRVRAEKKKSGRGKASEWIISHAELTRVRNEGLLPDPGVSARRVAAPVALVAGSRERPVSHGTPDSGRGIIS